ncbi:hypothetical protein AAVH_04461 [Aphelenchoides avenae]|nr:hypothetical protein AAVH_04461 [Aphelenchus avenae]
MPVIEPTPIAPQPSEDHAVVPYSPETSSEAYPIDPVIANPQEVASESKVCKYLDWQHTTEVLACIALALTASIVLAVISLFLIDIYVDGGIDGLVDRLLLQLEETAVAAGEMPDTATETSASATPTHEENNYETDAENCRTEAHC